MSNNTALSAAELSKLTTCLFSAALGQAPWEKFLEDLSDQSGGVCTHLFGFDTEADISFGLLSHGYAPEYQKSYDEHFYAINAWAPGFATHRVGEAIDSELMCSKDELLKSEFYNDWIKPQEDIRQGGGAIIHRSHTRTFMLGGNIRDKDADRLKPSWLNSVDQLVPHLRQAFEVSRTLHGARLEAHLVASHQLNEVPAVLMLSDARQVIYANPRGETMLALGSPVGLDAMGRLTLGGTALMTSDLSATLGSAGTSHHMVLQAWHDLKRYDLRFLQFTPEADIPLPLDYSLGLYAKCWVLMITHHKAEEGYVARFCQAYGLTSAEAEVLQHITEGCSNREIAERRGRAVETVKSQVKALMGKTGTKSRTQLMRLLHDFRLTEPQS